MILKDSPECFHTNAIASRPVHKTPEHVSVTLEILESYIWSYFSVHSHYVLFSLKSIFCFKMSYFGLTVGYEGV